MTLRLNEIPEAWLQDWFETRAQENSLCSAITNTSDLDGRLEYLKSRNKRTEDIERAGLEHAKDICRSLLEATILAADRSVSLNTSSQMRPDVILYTGGANYILVELKTKAAAERQGVQELLAYSAAIKLAYPYVNEFLFIVVAGAWDVLLQRSVQALIMEGRRILPLQWSHDVTHAYGVRGMQKEDVLEQLRLKIRLDLFNMRFVQPYDPFYAMSSSTLGVTVTDGAVSRARHYLGGVGFKAVRACQGMQQSGFVVGWTNPVDRYGYCLMSLVLVTVNQHWLYSEYLPSDFEPSDLGKPIGVGKLLDKKANSVYGKHTKGLDEDDFFGRSRAYCAVEELHPQSSLSYEVLERHRDIDAERHMEESWRNPSFEQGDDCNLKHLLGRLGGLSNIRANVFLPFGELADFTTSIRHRNPPYLFDVVKILEQFCEHKDGSVLSLPTYPRY